jgi:hypothetical protein
MPPSTRATSTRRWPPCTRTWIGRTAGRAAASEGTDQVREYWTRQWAAIDPTVEPVGFSTDPEGRAVVSVHQIVRDLHGRVVSDGITVHVYRIEDGLIRNMEIRTV